MVEHWELVVNRKELSAQRFIVISGPSGGGKTTFISKLVKSMDGVGLLVKHTDRSPRVTEKENVDYYFLSERAFEEQINENTAVVIVCRYEHHYALSMSEVKKTILQNKIPCFILDPDAALKFREIYPNSIIVFVAPYSKDEDILRVKSRNEDAYEKAKRIDMIEEEYQKRHLFDVNDYCESFEETKKLIEECLRRKR